MIGKVVVNPQRRLAHAGRTASELPGHYLSGFDQVVNATQQVWRAADTTGTGAGWNVTITGANFTSARARFRAISSKYRYCRQTSRVSGNTPPVTEVRRTLHGRSHRREVLSAATGGGAGTYDFTPEFRLTIRPRAGGRLCASLVVSINSGP